MQRLIKQKQNLLIQLSKCADIVKGSINSTCVNCNRSKCICKTKTTKRAFRLTCKDKNQKTVIVYVPKERLKEMKVMITNYAKCRKIIEQLIDVNVKLFKHKP